jgi:ABC-type ATPase involved in cell division
MCAIGRALMANPSVVLLDEPSMGLAPQIVEEVFEIVKDLNQQGKGHLPDCRAEHQHGPEVRRLRLHHGVRPHHDGRHRQRPAQQRHCCPVKSRTNSIG